MDLWTKSLETKGGSDTPQTTDDNGCDKPAAAPADNGGGKTAAADGSSSAPPSDPRRIGDIMLRYSPFLIMYTEYVKNFDTAMRTINNLYNKNSKFAAIMDTIHVS